VWGAVSGLAAASGVFLGGVLSAGPGWRWVLFVNPPIAAVLLVAVFLLIPGEGRRERSATFDLAGTVLGTGGILLLVYALVKAPDQGWGSGRTVGGLAAAGVLLIAFLLNEARTADPLVPLTIFRVRGLGAADITMLMGAAGLISMFYFLTLYMQTVLGFSPLKTGAAYLPFTAGVAVSATFSSQLMGRIGTRPVIVAGNLVGAGGLYCLSRIHADGSYVGDLLPGMLITSVGMGAMFVGIVTAANAGVSADRAGLAAALLNASQQIGGALGLAIFTAIATARTNHLAAAHAVPAHALTSGFHRALLAECVFVIATALLGLRTRNSHGEAEPAVLAAEAPTVPAAV
jgi:predicted MFS family arabinose efflux permease